ncbi:hypothetical protein VOLCADRAFT_102697 [Volvox carteri f. nagariensis]|uniref:DUF4149 domain-containing protein n=1 Tax=Volvox carteri f. nagariensis TaxID=3068 RepID=D8THH8_VOLCA|nr:uncharacterized protein VOLCADRAFT_102697 [Volvox carteri f. nagariensis]EFJ53074.1 hypothetical protein VOLCADRAFT_102697 [Volvox carteri f. nagariensis]|eukprot:XP_002946079.1 hypothetical protein VOLCADRAFT_102697 [Volvox carteri f. nagariensis]
MAKYWIIATAVAAVLSFVPWAIYLAGLGKLTQAISNSSVSEALKQTVFMLEWYTVSAQFINLVLILIACIVRGLQRTHSMFIMFLAVNSALLIVRATSRIVDINLIDEDPENAALYLDVPNVRGDPLKYLRAEACGQVASATMNFLLAILVGLAGTAQAESAEYNGAKNVA